MTASYPESKMPEGRRMAALEKLPWRAGRLGWVETGRSASREAIAITTNVGNSVVLPTYVGGTYRPFAAAGIFHLQAL